MSIRKALLAAAAASVLGVPAAVAGELGKPAAERFGWTGFYVGAHGGIAAGDFDYGLGPSGGAPVVTLGFTGSGGLVGGQLGYDWQNGNFVLGGVADLGWSGNRAGISASLGAPFSLSASAGSSLDYLGTLRVRGGYAFDRALVYAHGGLAFGDTTQTIAAAGTTIATARQSRTGWTIGAGVEYALSNRVTLASEYSYVDLGTADIVNNGFLQFTEALRFHTLKTRVNFRFGSAEGAGAMGAVTPAEGFAWTGFYAGLHGGIAAGDFGYDLGPSGGPSMLTLGVAARGGLVGGQAGYDWQSGRFVFGGVADIALSSYRAGINASLGAPFTVSASAGSSLDYLGTLRVRGGYAFDRSLIYAHGGFAYGLTSQSVVAAGTTVASATQVRTGWTIGAGIEYAVSDRLSFGTEYAYVDLGTRDLYNDGVIQFTETLRFHTVKALANFRF